MISFKGQTPSNKHGQLITNSREPLDGSASLLSKHAPPLDTSRVLPDPRRSTVPLLNNLYSMSSPMG
jgi:hypothetical protein